MGKIKNNQIKGYLDYLFTNKQLSTILALRSLAPLVPKALSLARPPLDHPLCFAPPFESRGGPVRESAPRPDAAWGTGQSAERPLAPSSGLCAESSPSGATCIKISISGRIKGIDKAKKQVFFATRNSSNSSDRPQPQRSGNGLALEKSYSGQREISNLDKKTIKQFNEYGILKYCLTKKTKIGLTGLLGGVKKLSRPTAYALRPQSYDSNIDYSYTGIQTKWGILGLKVLIGRSFN